MRSKFMICHHSIQRYRSSSFLTSHTCPLLCSMLFICLSHPRVGYTSFQPHVPLTPTAISAPQSLRGTLTMSLLSNLSYQEDQNAPTLRTYILFTENCIKSTILLSLRIMLSHKRKCQACFKSTFLCKHHIPVRQLYVC